MPNQTDAIFEIVRSWRTGVTGSNESMIALAELLAAAPKPAAPREDAEMARLRKYYEVTQHRIGLAKMALMRNNPGDASMHLAKLSDEIDEALTHPGHKHAQEGEECAVHGCDLKGAMACAALDCPKLAAHAQEDAAQEGGCTWADCTCDLPHYTTQGERAETEREE